jgi:flagellar hook-associated protein 1 FlgK
MSLNVALSSAVSSLLNIEKQMTVSATNISNANTTGYTKKTAEATTQVTAGVATGVTSLGITSKVDQFLLKDVVKATTASAQATTTDSYYQSLQKAMGSVSSSDTTGTDLSSSLNTLESTLSQLADTPDSTTLKDQVVSNLDDTASQLRQTSSSIQTQRSNADEEISTTVDDVNAQLDTIKSLNDQISVAANNGQSTADLQDQRMTALQSLSADVGVTYFVDGNNKMQIYTESGQALIDGTGAEHKLSHTSSGNLSASQTYASGSLDGITVDGKDITTQLSSGKLKALVDQRDTVLPNAQSELDKLAGTLASTLNTITNSGTTSPPPSSLTGTTSVTGSDAVSVASGTTLRVAVTDSSGNISSYQDLDLTGATSVDDVVAKLNTVSGVTASVSAGHLSVSVASGSGIAVSTLSGSIGGTDVSSYFGLNDVLTGGTSAATIAVRSDILTSPQSLSTATLNSASTLTVGKTAIGSSDPDISTRLANALSGKQSFTAAGALGASSTSFSNYAAAIISDISTKASAASTKSTSLESTLTSLQTDFSNKTGVNTDEETAKLTSLQNAYAASAQVITAAEAMFKSLLSAVQS